MLVPARDKHQPDGSRGTAHVHPARRSDRRRLIGSEVEVLDQLGRVTGALRHFTAGIACLLHHRGVFLRQFRKPDHRRTELIQPFGLAPGSAGDASQDFVHLVDLLEDQG